MKKLLFVISNPPYANKRGTELLDAALVAAAFDCDVSLLFRGDGVWSLLPEHAAKDIGQRSFAKMMLGLADYDIDKLFVCRDSLNNRSMQLNPELAIETISIAHQQQLMADQAAVIGAAI